jgi:hypothetical protein
MSQYTNGLIVKLDTKDFQRMLEELEQIGFPRERKAILRNAARKLVPYIKRGTPKDSGLLKKSVKAKTWSKSRDYFVVYDNKNLKSSVKSFYAYFQDQGFNAWGKTWIDVHKGFYKKAFQSGESEATKVLEREVFKYFNNYGS